MAKKKKPEEAPAGAPLWMATFADMATLLLAFFVMLLSFSSIQESKFHEAVASLNGAFGVMSSPMTVIEQPQVLIPEPTESEIQEVLHEVQKIRVELADEGLEDQVEVSLEKDGVAIKVATPFLFRPGRSEFRSENQGVIASLGRALSKTGNSIRVEGHTDNVPINNDEFSSNWELSSARALAVLRAFEAKGVAPSRLAAIGYGEFRPVASNDSEAGKAKNRRVEIFVETKPLERRDPPVTGANPAKGQR